MKWIIERLNWIELAAGNPVFEQVKTFSIDSPRSEGSTTGTWLTSETRGVYGSTVFSNNMEFMRKCVFVFVFCPIRVQTNHSFIYYSISLVTKQPKNRNLEQFINQPDTLFSDLEGGKSCCSAVLNISPLVLYLLDGLENEIILKVETLEHLGCCIFDTALLWHDLAKLLIG